MLTTPEEGLILILLFMLVEIDKRETAAVMGSAVAHRTR